MKKYLLLFSFIAATFLFGQESITKKYLGTDDLISVKEFSKTYTDGILAKKYIIKNLGDPNSNNYDVEYKITDESGYAVMIVNFDFRKRDFTIELKSMNYVNEKTSVTIPITKENKVKAIADFYERTKKLLLTLHADYLAPDIFQK